MKIAFNGLVSLAQTLRQLTALLLKSALHFRRDMKGPTFLVSVIALLARLLSGLDYDIYVLLFVMTCSFADAAADRHDGCHRADLVGHDSFVS